MHPAIKRKLESILEKNPLKEPTIDDILVLMEKAYEAGKDSVKALVNDPRNRFPIEQCVGVGKDGKQWYAFSSLTKGKEVVDRKSYPENMYFHDAIRRCHILLDEIESRGVET